MAGVPHSFSVAGVTEKQNEKNYNCDYKKRVGTTHVGKSASASTSAVAVAVASAAVVTKIATTVVFIFTHFIFPLL